MTVEPIIDDLIESVISKQAIIAGDDPKLSLRYTILPEGGESGGIALSLNFPGLIWFQVLCHGGKASTISIILKVLSDYGLNIYPPPLIELYSVVLIASDTITTPDSWQTVTFNISPSVDTLYSLYIINRSNRATSPITLSSITVTEE